MSSSPEQRARSSSIKQGLAHIPLADAVVPPTPTAAKTRAIKLSPPTFFNDLVTMKWMTNPLSSLKIIIAILTLWASLEFLPLPFDLKSNPLNPALFISYPLEFKAKDGGQQRFDKGLLDIPFLAFYVIVFSFIRQGVTEFLLRPLAKWSGLKSEAKQTRFMEQAYAVVYNILTAGLGLHAMYTSKAWYYKTEHFWIDYPHWRMTQEVKYYYLLQASYWLQQMLVLSLRLEKPRSDYYQLIIHHVVTLWLIGWSYLINLTVIGTAIFISMDIPEIFLAGSKCLNYVGLQHCSEVSFVALLSVWTYMRQYLNLVILWSVWKEFHLVPEYNRTWEIASSGNPNTWWVFSDLTSGRVPAWIQLQIFLPIFVLQLVNGFWYYLLWRILYRLVVGVKIADIREEGESDEEEDEVVEKKKDK